MLRLTDNSILLSLRPVKYFLLVFTLFFYLYGVNFTFLPVSTARIIVFIAFCYLLLKFYFKPVIPFRRSNLFLLLAFIVLAYWIFFISVVNGYRDSAMFTSVTLMLIHSFIGGWFFSIIFYNFGLNFRQVIFLIQSVITIQAVFILIYFVSWEFREFTFTYIPETGNIDYQVNLFQSRGLTHSSGAVLSVLQSLGVLFSAYLLSTAKYRDPEFIYLLLSFGLLCLSIFITGRTGILILPLVFVYFVLIVLSKSGIPKNIAYFSISSPIILIISFIGFKFVYQNIIGGITGATGEDIFDRVVRWYVEEFFSEDGFQSRTMSILSGHWFFPDNISGLLFGNPDTWGVNRIRSDIGYVRMWHGIGMVGVLVYYIFFLSLFFQMVLSVKAFPEKVMLGLLGFYLFFIEMKEPFMFNVYVNAFFILIFAYSVINKSKNVCETS
jgi:hypothetical protein